MKPHNKEGLIRKSDAPKKGWGGAYERGEGLLKNLTYREGLIRGGRGSIERGA